MTLFSGITPGRGDGSPQAEDEKLEKFLDEGYVTLKRFISQAKNHLVEGGSVLLGTVPYTNLSAIEEICAACGYTQEIVREGLGDLGNGVTEQYYIIQIRPHQGASIGQGQNWSGGELLYSYKSKRPCPAVSLISRSELPLSAVYFLLMQ